MFARTTASPARRGAGYVCLSCRHERVLSARQTQQRRRWNSELARHDKHPAAGQTDTEDWLLPLNNLSEDYGDKPAIEAVKSERSFDQLRSSLLESGRGKEDSERPKPRRQRVLEARKVHVNSSPGTRPKAASRPKDINGLLQSLQKENDGSSRTPRSRPPGEDEHALKRAPRTKSSAATAPPKSSSTMPTSRNPKMLELMESLGPDIQAGIEQLEADMEDNEVQYDEYLEKSATVAAPEPQVKPKEPVPFPSFLSKETPSTPTPTPPRGFFSSAMNYVKEITGLSKPSLKEKVEQKRSEKQAKSSESDNKPAAKQNYTIGNSLNTLKLSSKPIVPKSPVERWEESRSRTPWGKSPPTANEPDNRVAAFEDLASADSVLVKKPNTTRFSSRPFGSEPAPHTMADLRGQLKQNLTKEGAVPGDDEAVASEEAPVAPKTESDPALSRLTELHSARHNDKETAAELAPDAEDTLDLAYLRRQHDQERAEQDVKTSIRKHFSGVPLTNLEIEQAAKKEAESVLEPRSRRRARASRAASRKTELSRSPAADADQAESAQSASLGGMSLGEAMCSSPTPTNVVAKRRVGRPAKEPAASKRAAAGGKSPTVDITSSADPTASSESTDESEAQATPATSTDELRTSIPSQLHINPLDIPQPPVPFLQYGLDRVLFNSGVYQLQDEASRVYNFDPYLQNIMPNAEFDFDSLKEYKTSSKDEALAAIAREHGNKYIGSTSSMTSALGQFHYLLSNWRPLNYGMLSNDFVARGGKALPRQLTQINRAPSAIFLRWKNGTYAIDADKQHDSANVLMLLGKSMELLLTLPKDEFERYRKSDPRKVTEEQRTAPESYQYTTMRDFLMRSQLDAYDPRLPGNGTFDLKTRAVVSVRHAADDHEPMTGYEIYAQQGKWGSYEKEYYDMMRSTMLKYMLQARMGRMNGIFVAYHNVERMFGFQYLPIADMDRALHGQTDPSLGDQEFRASLDMMNEVLNAATKKFPEQSLRIHFETQEAKSADGMPTALHVFAEPMSEEECDRIQDSQKAKIAEWERKVLGKNIVVEDAEPSADEMKSADLTNEVVQDHDAVVPDDDTADATEADEATTAASDDDATAYARSVIDSGEATEGNTDSAEASTDNSTSHADPEFLNSLAAASSEGLRPLFYATIITQSHVNDQVLERPENLKPGDEWRIDYILKEYDIGSLQWAAYEDCQARRKQAYVKEAEEEGVEKANDNYIEFLKALSEKGRILRKAKDEREDGLPIVRVEDLDMERLDKVESVEDYMRFLEKPKERGSREMFG